MKQRIENRGRWVNNLQTTSVPGITLGLFSGSYIKDKKVMKKNAIRGNQKSCYSPAAAFVVGEHAPPFPDFV